MGDYNDALQKYFEAWSELVATAHNQQFFDGLRPAALGWKVENRQELDARFEALRESCDYVYWGLINGRWIVTMHLREDTFFQGIKVIKLMERRPGSVDRTGLDHVDFLAKNIADAGDILEKEAMQWTYETENPYVKWYSIWFANTEAKIRDKSVIAVCIDELEGIKEA